MHTTSRARRGRSSVSIAEYAFANRPLQMTFKASVDKKYYIYNSGWCVPPPTLLLRRCAASALRAGLPARPAWGIPQPELLDGWVLLQI